MTLIDQIRRIERLDYLIRTRSTGTPAELAKKLGMSQSHTYKLLRLIKETMNAPVIYSKVHRSYCYKENVKFTFGFWSNNMGFKKRFKNFSDSQNKRAEDSKFDEEKV